MNDETCWLISGKRSPMRQTQTESRVSWLWGPKGRERQGVVSVRPEKLETRSRSELISIEVPPPWDRLGMMD